jgi:hypothetical protein
VEKKQLGGATLRFLFNQAPPNNKLQIIAEPRGEAEPKSITGITFSWDRLVQLKVAFCSRPWWRR